MFSFKKLSILALLTTFLLCFTTLEGFAQTKTKSVEPETQGQGLKGKVINARSGEAIKDAEIHIVGKEIKAKTGKDGRFTFEKLPTGAYTFKVDEEGYKKYEQEVEVKEGLKVVLMIEPEKQ